MESVFLAVHLACKPRPLSENAHLTQTVPVFAAAEFPTSVVFAAVQVEKAKLCQLWVCSTFTVLVSKEDFSRLRPGCGEGGALPRLQGPT